MREESEIQREILLKYGNDPRLRLWRSNAGAATGPGGQFVRFGLPGQGDISGILGDGTRIEIEVKAPGGRLSDKQRAFGEMIEKWKGIYVVARSVGDVEQALADRGWE